MVTLLNGVSSLFLMVIPSLENGEQTIQCKVGGGSTFYCHLNVTLEANDEKFYKTCLNSNVKIVDEAHFEAMNQTSISVNCADIPNNWHNSFWLYLTVRVAIDILRASSLMLFEGSAINI